MSSDERRMRAPRGGARTSTAKTAVVRGGDFAGLVAAIREVNAECARQAFRAVNVSLTLRNWLIGAHIHHYELHGTDRAEYGERLLAVLAQRLAPARVSNTDKRQSTAICASSGCTRRLWGQCPHNSPPSSRRTARKM